MNIWLEGFQYLLVAVLVALLLGMRSWLTVKKARSPEEEAVDDIARSQGTFNLHEPGVVRQRFARRYEIKFQNNWACAGKWVPYE